MTQTMKPAELGIEELLTTHQVAEMLRVTDTTVSRWALTGVLDSIQMLGPKKVAMYRFKASVIDAIFAGSVEDVLTTQEFARWIHVHASTVVRWARSGALDVVRLPRGHNKRGEYRVRVSTVNALVGEK
jgi:predicted site-specific integrase-resolvase